ncbi:hypothetical protein [Mariniphaga sp.]|uniref:hypothetical protein n=1 Tax=Mariniphaga sp. TaxID=1954475 RepID=UPI00356637E0
MSYSIQYKELFGVKILHRYFLDKGSVEFRTMNETEKVKQLNNYNFQGVVKIVPTKETVQNLNGHNLVFKTLDSGFTVWSKVSESDDSEPFISLDDDLNFTFLIQIKDSVFYNYTDLQLENAGKLYYLSNKGLDSEPNNFPLLDKSGGNFHVDEDFILSAEGEKVEKASLNAGEKERLLGLIRIYMKGDNSSLNLTNAQGKIPSSAKIFEVVFKNRSTIWRYLFDSNQQVTGGDDVKRENGNSKVLITKNEHPLTKSGFISVELGGVELPNPGVALIKPDAANNKIFSEIYM